MDFPPEIVEKILCYLNGKSLGRVCQINKTWYLEVSRLTQKKATWKRCIKEIPYTNIIELGTNLDLHLPATPFNDLPETSPLKDWSSLYINWCMWTHLSRWTSTTTIIPNQEEVSCAKLSGNCIVTGHTSGEIKIWSINGSQLAFCFTHRRKVKDLLLVALGPFTMENAGMEMSKGTNLELSHQCVITTSLDEQLAITYFIGTVRVDGLMKLHRPEFFMQRAVICAKVIPKTNNLLVVVHEGNNLLGMIYKCSWMYDMHESKTKLKLTYATEFTFPGKVNTRAISCFPPNKIAVLTKIEDTQYFLCINFEESLENMFTFTSLESAKFFLQDATIFRANICLWIRNAATTRLHVYCNDSTQTVHEVRLFLPGEPTCFLLHGPTLFVGTVLGSVMAFDASNLPTLELDKPHWTTHFKCGPIVAIQVSGGSFGIRLVVASAHHVYFVNFHTYHCMPDPHSTLANYLGEPTFVPYLRPDLSTG